MRAVDEFRSFVATSFEQLSTSILPWISAIAYRVNRVFPKDGTEVMLAPLPLEHVANADLPTASDETGNVLWEKDGLKRFLGSNGANWIDLSSTGGVTAVTGTAPIVSSGGSTPAISITTSSTSAKGAVELATSGETITGTSTTLAITPSGLTARTSTTSRKGIIELATKTEAVAGSDALRAITPNTLTDRLVAPGSIGSVTEGNISAATLGWTKEGTSLYSGSNNQLTIHNTNESYPATLLALQANRSASASYHFIQCQSDFNGTPDTEFRVNGVGQIFADQGTITTPADFAEYREWVDGNPNNEDRRGIAVVMVEGKIREALEGEQPFGIISGKAAFIGNAAEGRWHKKFLKDDYGAVLFDEEGHRVLNPAYDDTLVYVNREKRSEWEIVGMVGQVTLRKGQQVDPRWIRMWEVSDSLEEWHVR